MIEQFPEEYRKILYEEESKEPNLKKVTITIHDNSKYAVPIIVISLLALATVSWLSIHFKSN